MTKTSSNCLFRAAIWATFHWSAFICHAQTPVVPPVVLGGMLPVDATKLELLEIAALASESAYPDGFNLSLLDNIVRIAAPLEEGGDVDIDAAVIHTTDDYCVAAWQGTGANTEDWLQNRPSGSASAISKTNPNFACQVSEGFWDAYNNSRRFDIEAAIDQCMLPFQRQVVDEFTNQTTVTTQQRQLILSGHSQGAAIALVASIVLEAYQPLVIGYAQPSTFKAPCAFLNPQNNWRIVNTIQSLITLRYDVVPYTNRGGGFAFFEDPTGPSLMLPPAEPETANFFGRSALYENFYLESANPTVSQLSIAAHSMTNHLQKVSKLRTLVGPNENLMTGGFADGTWCNDDTELVGTSEHAVSGMNSAKADGATLPGEGPESASLASPPVVAATKTPIVKVGNVIGFGNVAQGLWSRM